MNDSRRAFREIDQIVVEILATMSLKEKALIANMDEKSLPYLQYAFDVYINREVGNDPQRGQAIMRRLWQTLHETHRIRLVSGEGKP